MVLGAPTITNVTLVAGAGSIAIPANTAQFTMQCRTAVDIKIAKEVGITNWITMKSGGSYNSPQAALVTTTYYFQGVGVEVIEVITWPLG